MNTRYLLACAIGVIAPLQFIPDHLHQAAVIPSQTLERNTAVPGGVEAVLRNACMNCHSNETKRPWYSRVAPISWLIVRDVKQARASVNFSEWGLQKRATKSGYLMAACANVKSGRMPPAQYLWMHPEAHSSPNRFRSATQD